VTVDNFFSRKEKNMAELKGFMFIQDGQEYDLRHLPDGFVIKGNVGLENYKLTELPDLSKVIVEGCFDCNHNELVSLKGAPQKVGKTFYCRHNYLTSLEGAPQEIGGSFDCTHNNLTSLEGAPQKVGRDFFCGFNRLRSLKGAPQEIGGNFHCEGNYTLKSFEGLPLKVGGDFLIDEYIRLDEPLYKEFIARREIQAQIAKNKERLKNGPKLKGKSGVVIADEIAKRQISGEEKRVITPGVGKELRQEIMRELNNKKSRGE